MSDKNEDTTRFFTIRGSEPRAWQCDKCECTVTGPVSYCPDAMIFITRCPNCGRRVTHVDGKETYSEFFDAVVPEGVEWPMVDGEPVVPGDVLWDESGNRREVRSVNFITVGCAPCGAPCS